MNPDPSWNAMRLLVPVSRVLLVCPLPAALVVYISVDYSV